MKHNLLSVAILLCAITLQAETARYTSMYQVMNSSQDSTHNKKVIGHKKWATIERDNCVHSVINDRTLCGRKLEQHEGVMMGCDLPEEGDGYGQSPQGKAHCAPNWKILKANGGNNVSYDTGDIHFGDVISLKVDNSLVPRDDGKPMVDSFLTVDNESTRLSETKGDWEEFEMVNPGSVNDRSAVQKGQNFALKAKSNGKYLTGEVNGDLRVRSKAIGAWEKWHFEDPQ